MVNVAKVENVNLISLRAFPRKSKKGKDFKREMENGRKQNKCRAVGPRANHWKEKESSAWVGG